MTTAYQLGYCTNVHAGADLEQYWANLRRHAVGVKERFSPKQPMGIGLWFSANAAEQLLASDRLPAFRDWLRESGLLPFTFNGFPHGDFHERVVKHRVYLPTWMDVARLRYTEQLVEIQHRLLPAGVEGSISTLPIAWGTPTLTADQAATAAANLRTAAKFMRDYEVAHGRLIHLALEPEPGCVFTWSQDIIRFYDEHLLRGVSAAEEAIIRRHIRVCHDVCHAAVMFEDQTAVLKKYQAAGIEIGKFQISAAVRMALDSLPPCGSERSAAIEQLETFREERYLHQTVVKRQGQTTYYEDLPAALAAERDLPYGEWRVHFHVPIFLSRFGKLQSTQDQIIECLQAARETTNCRHLEVETYAWSVLPPEMQQPELADGIAQEMSWLAAQLTPSTQPVASPS